MIRTLTADDIVKIIFQTPSRVTAGLCLQQFDDDDRSFQRAVNELRLCPLLGPAQTQQIIDCYKTVAPNALTQHLDQQFFESETPENLAFGYDILWDDKAYLGMRVDAFDLDKPMNIVEHNPAADAIKAAIGQRLEYYFPRHDQLRVGTVDLSL